MKDFTFNKEDKLFVHDESGFMLDTDFVLLFEDDLVKQVFRGATGKDLDEETLSDLRSIIREFEEDG